MKEIMYSIRKNRFGEYTVESSHDVGKFYDVYYYSAKKSWLCTCRYFALFQSTCIHIDAVKNYDLTLGQYLDMISKLLKNN